MIYILDNMMNVKIISSGACDIYLRVANYCLVQFMGVIINCNVKSVMVFTIINLVQIGFFML